MTNHRTTTRLSSLFVALSVSLASAAAASSSCTTPSECSFNGVCDVDGRCDCDPGWSGSTCSTLNLLPARVRNGLNATEANGPVSSWGGSVNQGDDGKWHMHAAAFQHNCGINQWNTNSYVVHAVSDSPDGVYTIVDVPVPLWAHNPSVVRSPDTGEWVMTYVANTTAKDHPEWQYRCDQNGKVVRNGTIPASHQLFQSNFIMFSTSLSGPWSSPMQLDHLFDRVVPPFLAQDLPNRNTNLIVSLRQDGSMTGMWRRCCTPPQKYAPPGGGGKSVIFGVRAHKWRDLSSWVVGGTPLFPDIVADGYEDPFIYPDPRHSNVYHGMFHNMIGGWHEPAYNNTQVGAHAYSKDGGLTWVDTGVAFNTTVVREDGTSLVLVRRERPHVVLDAITGMVSYLTSGATYAVSEAEPSATMVQPVARQKE